MIKRAICVITALTMLISSNALASSIAIKGLDNLGYQKNTFRLYVRELVEQYYESTGIHICVSFDFNETDVKNLHEYAKYVVDTGKKNHPNDKQFIGVIYSRAQNDVVILQDGINILTDGKAKEITECFTNMNYSLSQRAINGISTLCSVLYRDTEIPSNRSIESMLENYKEIHSEQTPSNVKPNYVLVSGIAFFASVLSVVMWRKHNEKNNRNNMSA